MSTHKTHSTVLMANKWETVNIDNVKWGNITQNMASTIKLSYNACQSRCLVHTIEVS